MKTSQAVAQRTRELLKEKKLTQYRLEQNTGIPHNTMISLMSGKNDGVNLKTVMLIVLGLDVTVSEFFNSPIFDPKNLELK